MKSSKIINKILVVILSIPVFLSLGVFNKVDSAASLYFAASATSVHLGNTFTIFPKVNTGGDATNAYAFTMSFPADKIEPTTMSKGGSICTLYTHEPSYTASTASVSCGLPTPGYNGTAGGLGSVTFRAKNLGSATITYSGGAQVLANDGQGTNILGSTGSITITIVEPPPPPIDAPTVKCSVGKDGEWINVNDVTFTWKLPPEATGFNYILTKNQGEGVPHQTLGTGDSKDYSKLEDGIYYFKIVATDGEVWSAETTYTLMIDTTPPIKLKVESSPSNDKEIDKLPLISFNAIDKLSGMDHYEIKIDDGDFVKTKSPYKFKELTSGEHTITVRAYDKAGNYTEETITIKIKDIAAPVITKPVNGSYIPLAEKLVVEGKAEPNSLVYIYLNGEKIAEVVADEGGNFTYTHDAFLPKGKYELYAVSKNEGGIISPKSEYVYFNVDPYAIRIGSIVIPSICLCTFIPFLIVLLVLLLIILYKKYRDKKKESEQDLDKVKKKVHEEFEELERDARNEIEETLTQDTKQRVSKKIEHQLEREVSEEIEEAKKDIDETIDKLKSAKKEKKGKKEKKTKKKDKKASKDVKLKSDDVPSTTITDN